MGRTVTSAYPFAYREKGRLMYRRPQNPSCCRCGTCESQRLRRVILEQGVREGAAWDRAKMLNSVDILKCSVIQQGLLWMPLELQLPLKLGQRQKQGKAHCLSHCSLHILCTPQNLSFIPGSNFIFISFLLLFLSLIFIILVRTMFHYVDVSWNTTRPKFWAKTPRKFLFSQRNVVLTSACERKAAI